MLYKIFFILSALIVVSIILLFITDRDKSTQKTRAASDTRTANQERVTTAPQSQDFLNNGGLTTDTSIASIPLDKVLGGGPAKDGIPALNDLEFETVASASTWLDDDSRGILYTDGNVTRFYPYAILYWHEIVNDIVGSIPISVTFCPLCGTAMVFDRRVNGEILQFGVSGKLYQSNLLMYDTATESLWSQARGTAVVGTQTEKSLTLLSSSLITFSDVLKSHPQAEVLSRKTGYTRNYTRAPYGDYETNEKLIFPTEEFDAQFHPKELFIVAPLENVSLGFHFANLRETKTATVTHNDQVYTATIMDDASVKITNATGAVLPHYVTMYFSWSVHDERTKVIWEK